MYAEFLIFELKNPMGAIIALEKINHIYNLRYDLRVFQLRKVRMVIR
jgi:hypothetical protein